MQIAYTSLCLHVPTLNQITYKRWGLKTQNYYFSAYQLTGCTSCCHRNGTIQLTTPPPPTPTPAPSPPLLLLTRPGRVQGSVAVMNITPYTYHYIFNMQFFSYTAAIDIPSICWKRCGCHWKSLLHIQQKGNSIVTHVTLLGVFLYSEGLPVHPRYIFV